MKKIKSMRKFVIAIFFVATLAACNQGTQDHKKNPAKSVENPVKPSLIKENIISTGIFSYYLPSNYTDTVKLPVFFIFDPHGEGKFPLNKYFPLAEKYGFILAASNVSKNGLPQNQIENIIRQFFQKVSSTFSFDRNRIYVMGFSGGARVASIAAMEQRGVRGMILCGGGLAYRGLPQEKKITILSFAGNEDFNLLELMSLDTLLSNSYHHLLLRFHGHHQWPDSLSMENAFYWTLFNEMRDSIIPVNDTLISRFMSVNRKKLGSETNVLSKYLLLKKIVAFADGLTDVKKYRSQLHEIEQSNSYKSFLKKFNRTIIKEKQQEQFLVQNMANQSYEWWQGKIKTLTTDTSGNSLSAVSHKRILNYLSLVAYMQSNNALKENQDNYAGHFIGLYQLIDPENTEGYYMEALLAVRKNNLPDAIAALQKAVKLGFSDFDRMNNEQAFQPLFNSVEFQSLLDKVRILGR